MKVIIFLATLFMSTMVYSQVGVNTADPQATLDVVGDATTAGTADGIIAPRMTASQLFAKNVAYTPAKTGAIVYITDANLTAVQLENAKVSDVTTTGYYSFNGEKWIKFGEGETEKSTVFFNGNNPNTATIFSLEPPIDDDGAPNPLFINDNNLKQKASYEYNGEDGSNWSWNGTTYVTKVARASTPFYRLGGTNDAGSNKTASIWRPGRVGMGNQAKNPETSLHIFTNNYAVMTLQGQGNVIRGRNGGGSGPSSVTTPSNTEPAKVLLELRGSGYINADKWTDQGAIRIVAAGRNEDTVGNDPTGINNWISNNKPSQIEFFTTPRGLQTLTKKMILTESGVLLVNRITLNSSCLTCTIQTNGGIILNSSNAIKSSGTTWTNPSDARIKKEVKPFSEGLDAVLKLRPVTYKFNELAGVEDTNEAPHIGFIAQEVEKVAPFMVKKVDDTKGASGLSDKRVLDESALTKILVNAIKEQQAQIEALKAEIEALKVK